MTRPFLLWPDPRLRKAAEPIEAVDDKVRAIWDEMVAAMDAMPGIGLAAPQIGVMRHLAVVDASETRGQVIRIANPRLLQVSDETIAIQEASPNLPGVSAEVVRPISCTVAYLDEGGSPCERELDGLWARSVQHQIDHLSGRMYFHRLSRLKRDRLLKKAGRRQIFS
ncbi:peptide deformylase [Aestuariibius insulae]|uniref:peptide deformylase n=1 Tax=Aestuariibius insulae TaxID=2058287 RepID=UPI00345EFA4B